MTRHTPLLERKRRTLDVLGQRGDDVATQFKDVDPGLQIPCSRCGHDCRGVLTDCGARCPECGRFTVYRYWFPRSAILGGLLDRRRRWALRTLRRMLTSTY